MMAFILIVMLVLYMISCLFLIVVILGQEGKGGGLSGLMGASALGEALGASTAESTLRRWTRNCAILFVVLSLGLTIVGSKVFTRSSILDGAAGVPETGRTGATAPEIEITTAPAVSPSDVGPTTPAPSALPIRGPVTQPAAGTRPTAPTATLPEGLGSPPVPRPAPAATPAP